MRKINSLLLFCFLALSWQLSAQITTYPHMEGFEGGTFPPTNWTLDTIAGTNSWSANNGNSNSSVSARTGTSNAYFYVPNTSGSSVRLITPAFDLTGLTTPELVFYNTQVAWGADQDTLGVYYKTSAAGTWTYLTSFTNNITSWNEVKLTLPNPSNDYYVAFEGFATWGRGVTVDDFMIRETPSCTDPSGQSVSAISLTSADVNWVENGTATTWKVEYGAPGFTPGSGTVTTVMTDTFTTLTGLTGFTDYDWYVTAMCSATDSSLAVGPNSFFTGYCTPNPSSVDGDGITNVTFDVVNNTTTTEPGNYGDYSAMVGDIAQNTTASVDITLSTGFTYGTKIWVDWNDDLDFTDAGEEVYFILAPSTNPTTVNATFMVPAMATLGQHRMRIGGADNNVGVDPCYTGTWASFEDYTVNVVPAPACLTPTMPLASSVNATDATINWTENGTATEWEVEYGAAGFTLGAGTVVQVLTDTFTTISSLTASTAYDWYVRAVCGPADSSSWTSVSSFMTTASPVTVPYSQDFEGASPLADFTTSVGSDAGLFLDAGSNCAATNSLHMTGGSFSGWTGGSTTTTVTQAWTTNTTKQSSAVLNVDATGVTAAGMELLFDLKQQWSYGSGYSWARIMVNGTQISPDYQPATQNADPCTNHILDLSAYIGTSFTISFEFSGKYDNARGNNGNGDNAFYDNIQIVPITCPDPSNLTVTAITATSADLNWTENGTATTWNVEYGPQGFTPGTGTSTVATATTLSLTGLTTYTSYDFYVQSDCGPDSSRLVGPTTFTVGAPLAGAYTIDSAIATGGTNFESFSVFATAINTFGVSAAVDVSVAANTYNDQCSLGDFPGSSMTNTVTIDGNGAATLTHDKSIRNSTMTVEGTSWLTIKNMTIAATGGLDSWGIHLFDSAHHITIDSNVIQLPVGATGDVAGIIGSNSETSDAGSGNNAFDIVISNNSITGGERGVSLYGSFTATARNSGMTISNNTFANNDDNGIYLTGYDNVTVTGNTVSAPNQSFGDGMYCSDLENFDISGNSFSGGDLGFDADDLNFDNTVTVNSTISNNMFIGGDDAFYLDDVENINIFHNTTYGEDYGFYLNDHANLDIRNNIFYSNSDYAFYALDSVAIVLNYNIYNTNGTTDLIRFGGTTQSYADLAAFVAAAPTLNAKSLEGDPTFVGNGIDLHVSGALANDVGDNTVGITTDIDGDARPLAPSTIVDIGADEYAPPACLVPSLNPASSIGPDSAIVSWVENGTAVQWEVEYDTAGFTLGTGTASIVSADTFLLISGLSSNTDYDYYVRAICGARDTSAWSGSSSFKTQFVSCLPTVAATLPIIEGWENNSGTVFGTANLVCNPSYTWVLETSLPEGRGRFGVDADDRATGTGAITLDRSPSGAININYLILNVDMSSYTTNTDLELFFDYRHHGEESHPNDSLWVRGSSSDPWVGIYDLYANRSTTFITVGALDIDAALTAASQTVSSTFQIRFGQEDNFPTGSDGFSFDNIVLRQTPSCFAPIGLVTSVITTTTADLSWNDTNTVTAPEYQYSVGPANFTAGTGTQMVVTTDSVTVSGLMPSTAYDWYVRAICGSGDTSLWSSVSSFSTLCVPFVAPITESFDNATIPTCWSQSAVQDGPWVFGTPGFTWNTQGCAGIPTDVTGNAGNYAALDFSGTGVVDVILEMNDVDVSGLTNPYLDFYFYMCGLTYTPINILYVEAFDGTNWNLVDSIQEHTNGWKRYGFDISGAVYSTNLVKIRFRASSAGNTITMFRGDQAIDDVTIGDAPAVELRALEVIRPLSGCGLSATDTVEFSIVNEGSMAQSNFDVAYAVNGVAITPETFTATILPGDTMNFTFQTPVDLSTPGVYAINAYTSAMNDFNVTNDSAATSVISTASSSVFPYAESFETGNGGWLVAGNAAWELGAPAGVFINSASDGTQAWVTDLDANYPDNALGYVISPCFDFTNVDYPYITMDIWYDIESRWDGSLLEASTDGGLTWSVVGEKNDPNNWYNDSAQIIATNNIAADGRAWTGNGSISGVPSSMGWINAQHELHDLAGEPKVQLRVLFASDGNTNDDGMAFDNVRIVDSVLYAPVGDINQITAAGTPVSDGEAYFTSGIVMGSDLDGNAGYLFTVIDMSSGSQEGIGVFSSVDVSGYTVNQGDSILIRGTVGQFRGLTQLSNIDSISVIASNVTLPTPIEVNFPSEGTESKWIKINNVHSLEVSGAAGSNNNHDFFRFDPVKNDNDTLTVRVDRDTDVDDSLGVYPIAIGDSLCSITGIGGQFSFAANLDDGYQIVIHRYSDIDTSACSFIVGIDDVVEDESIFSISPNPSKGEFVLKTDGFTNSSVNLTIRDINGRMVSNEFINNANNSFNKTFDLGGESKGVYFITITDGNDVINKKLILQ